MLTSKPLHDYSTHAFPYCWFLLVRKENQRTRRKTLMAWERKTLETNSVHIIMTSLFGQGFKWSSEGEKLSFSLSSIKNYKFTSLLSKIFWYNLPWSEVAFLGNVSGSHIVCNTDSLKAVSNFPNNKLNCSLGSFFHSICLSVLERLGKTIEHLFMKAVDKFGIGYWW